MEATRKFGMTPAIEYAPAHSPKLGQRIVATMKGREARIAKHAAGTIAPWHGLFLMGKHLEAALDAVERLRYQRLRDYDVAAFGRQLDAERRNRPNGSGHRQTSVTIKTNDRLPYTEYYD